MAASPTEPRLSNLRPTPLDLPLFLPYASAQLQAAYAVRVVTQIQEEYVSKTIEEKGKKGTKAKSAISHPTASRTRAESQERAADAADDSGSHQPNAYGVSDEIVVVAVQDAALRLVELCFLRCPEIPRLLVQIVALCVPYQSLLTKLTIRWAPLEGEALYEIAKFLPASQLTEVCLDDSPVPQKNYHLLLQHAQLQRLSLARCNLDDEVCAALAAALHHPLPASHHLLALCLSSNALSDVSARALAEALRCNRTLQHLNLSGNRITDDGALALLRIAAEFPLTYEELTAKRWRFIEHLRLKKEAYARCLAELTSAGAEEGGARGAVKRRTMAQTRARKQSLQQVGTAAVGVGAGPLDPVAQRAEAMATELVGPHSDPFGLEETVSRDGYVYSLGNASLCYLNLAYNELSYSSVVALCDVLQYQSATSRRSGSGLLRVLLDGNALPEACEEYAIVNELLERAVSHKISKPSKKVEKSKSKTGRQ